MKIIGIIPSRYESKRFPGKAMALINGKPMIQHVFDNANTPKSGLTYLYVATDDIRIFDHMNPLSDNIVYSGKKFLNGTERCYDAATQFLIGVIREPTIIINIQGDLPMIHPNHIRSMVDYMKQNPEIQIATLIKAITKLSEIRNTNIVKVKFGQDNTITKFYRKHLLNDHDRTKYKHIGIYAYRADILKHIATLPPTESELDQGLEQLRWMEAGIPIHYKKTFLDCPSVDVPEDLDNLKERGQDV